MTGDGYEWGSAGRERFTRDFGVIETIERITVEDNACSKKTVTIKRSPSGEKTTLRATPPSRGSSPMIRPLAIV